MTKGVKQLHPKIREFALVADKEYRRVRGIAPAADEALLVRVAFLKSLGLEADGTKDAILTEVAVALGHTERTGALSEE